ncbi:unnamed protein product [Caenorhabditis brenneri]
MASDDEQQSQDENPIVMRHRKEKKELRGTPSEEMEKKWILCDRLEKEQETRHKQELEADASYSTAPPTSEKTDAPPPSLAPPISEEWTRHHVG